MQNKSNNSTIILIIFHYFYPRVGHGALLGIFFIMRRLFYAYTH